MRIVANPIYRAFPELDAFDDARCREYLQRAQGGVVARTALVVATVVSSAGTVVVLLLGLAWSMPLIQPTFGSWDGNTVLGSIAALMSVVFGLGLLVWRDLLLRLLVLRVLRAAPRCPSCDYSTMGLLVSGSFAATCPECGHGIDLAVHREHCVPGIGGALRFMPPPGVLLERRRFWTLERRRAAARTVRRIAVAAMFVGVVVLPAAALVFAECWSARSDRAAGLTPEELDAALRPEGVHPSGDSIATQLAAISCWNAHAFPTVSQRVQQRLAGSFRWGVVSAGAMVPEGTAAQDLQLLPIADISPVADRIAEGVTATMRSPTINSPYGKDWIRNHAVPVLWQLAEIAMAAAVERADGPSFARSLEWRLAAMRIIASTPPFVIINANEASIVRVTAEALHADGGAELAMALDAALRRQSVRPSMEAMKTVVVDSHVDALASWFVHPAGVLWPQSSDVPTKWMAQAWAIHWVGLYWPQRRAIRENAVPLFEELMADPSDRDRQRALAAVVALADAGPIVGTRFFGLNSFHSTSFEMRGALLERALVTVVALERFRRSEGHLPTSLEELRPGFVDAVPKDPFGTGPFVYRLLPADSAAPWHPGYTLWSVGANGSDDGGSADSDVVFVPPPPWPEPSADPPAPDATRGN